MKRIFLSLLLLLATYAAALAQSPPTNVRVCSGTPPTCTPVSAANPLPVTASSGGGATFGAAFPATGQAIGFLDGTNMVGGRATSAALADAFTPPTSGLQQMQGFNLLFNGSSWDRQFTCPNTAVVNVTAGNTTEIVALTAAQTIRVCAFGISMSAAGTAAFVYGTGTNCGSGTTSITGAIPLATATPMTIASGNGSVLRTASANALCVAAVTGNVVGWVTYAKY